MIAVEHADDRLVVELKGVDEFAEKGVGGVNEVQVAAELRLINLLRQRLHDRVALLIDVVFVVLAVGLYGDRHDEVARFGGVERLEDFAGEHGVLCPADGRVGDVGHVLQRIKAVEAELA